MTRRSIPLVAVIVIALLLIVPSAYGGEVGTGTDRPDPTSSPDSAGPPLPTETALVLDTPIATAIAQAETAEPEAISLPKGEGGIDKIQSTRTPAPTATPGVIQEAVADFTAATGLAQKTFLGLTADDWINLVISALLVLIGYLVGTWLVWGVLRRAARRTPSEFDEVFLEAIGPQIRWLVVVVSARFATIRLTFLSAPVKTALQDLYFVLLLILGISISWRIVSLAFASYREELASHEDVDRLDPVLTLLQRIAFIAIMSIGLIILLSHFGVNVTALTAILGITGLALSLAAHDTLSDAISGFIILVDQPFRVGDRIEVLELDTWGDVVQIGTRTTHIRTRDNRMVIVPNSTIGKSPVVNLTFPDPHYRVQMDIGVGYGINIEQTRQIIIDTVCKVEGVLQDKPVDVLYNEMGDSAMMFRVRWWIESYADRRRTRDRVNTALQHALDEAGIEMPFTTYDINFKVGAEEAIRISQALKGLS
jgi:MscS family membrane protein